MQFTRIDRLKNYRIFRDFTWPADLPAFGKFNLVYGWNGSGKTALSSIFRRAQSKEPNSEGEVKISIDGSPIDGAQFDKATSPQVRVFNRDSVNRNVFEFPHHELPAVYALGEDSVSKQEEVQRLKQDLEKKLSDQVRAERRRANADLTYENHCADRAREIKNLLTISGGGAYNNYDKTRYKNAARRLSDAQPAVPSLTEELRQKYLATKASIPLDKIPAISQIPDIEQLSKKIDELLAKEIVSKAIEELVTDPDLAQWVGNGLLLHTRDQHGDTCLFCKQPLKQDRLVQLQAHFNDEFRLFQDQLTAAAGEINGARQAMADAEPPPKALLYPHLAQQYEAQVANLKQQAMYIEQYLSSMRSAVNAKKEQPFKKFRLASFLATGSAHEPEGGWETFLHIVVIGIRKFGATSGQNAYSRLNVLLAEHNKHTDNFAAEVAHAREMLEQDEIVASFEDYRKRKDALRIAREKCDECGKAVSDLQKRIAVLEGAIRQHQRPADELNREMAAYLGRDELRFSVRQTGYVISRYDQPAVNLSEGERTAIAFMYFLKSLSDTGFDFRNGVVVIDDPISSLDVNSTYSAFGFMRARTMGVGQLFVFTHNFLFFRQVRNWFHNLRGADKKEGRFYMLKCAFGVDGARSAYIERLDPLLLRYESEYHYLFKRVYEEAHRTSVDDSLASYYDLPNVGRRLLEGFLAFRAPGLAGEPYRQLDALEIEPARKARLLRFLDTYSHHDQVGSEGQDFSFLAEAPAVLRDVLALIREKDAGHYESMKALVQSETAELGPG
jgi:wobble nucleotide-excising tRNase